jgi:hypothetical protein
MKKVLLYLPVVLGLVILGAHFMRYGNWFGVAGAVFVLALLFLRQPWVARVAQVVLVLGALEWLRTLYMLAQLREAMGEPYLRMAVILGAVAALTFCAALVFESKTLKSIYRRDA